MKKTIVLFVLTAMLLSIFPSVWAQTQYYYDGAWHDYYGNTFNLKVNGEVLNTEMPPIVFDGYSVVPVRDVFEKLGTLVEWNGSTQTVYISNDIMTLSLKINSTVCYAGHITGELPIAPKIINGKTMVPVRGICDIMGYYVDFDSSSDTVIVAKSKPQQSIPSNVNTNTNGNISVTGASYSVSGDGVVLTMSTTGTAQHNAFYLENPLRLVVDITNGGYSSLPADISLSVGGINGIRFGQNNGARVVFDLSQRLSYDVQKSSGAIVIAVGTAIEGNQSLNSEVQTEPFYLNIKASGGRDYLSTNAQVGSASRYNSPDRIEFEITGNNLPKSETESNPGGNFVQSIKYTPVSDGKAKVTLYIKDSNYSFVQTQGELYIMAQKTANIRSVMIDAGHGGNDVGAVGYTENGTAEAYEKDFNLDVALRLKKELLKYNVEVHMIRETDTYVDFQQVGSIANDAGTTLFVSVHTNSATAQSANGIETWAYLEDNASSLNGMTGERLAEIIQNELIYVTKAADRGVKNGKSLAVIRTTSMPAVLVEMGFISNESDRHKLMDENYRQQIAEAIAMGILVAFNEMGI